MPKKKQVQLFVAPEPVGRPRKIGNPDEMWTEWLAYKFDCDNHMKPQTVLDKAGNARTVLVSAPLTHTIEGFCLFLGITTSSFDRTYRSDEDYKEMIELMELDTHIDARSKFEDGSLNPKLAALWMGRHKGYSTKQETEITGGVPVVIVDDLGD